MNLKKEIQSNEENIIVPLVIFAYNRPHLLKQVLDAVKIQTTSPPLVWVFIDGAKSAHIQPLVNECYRLAKSYQNELNIKITQREVNLGIGHYLPQGFDDVFQEFESLIMLEDDIVPNQFYYENLCQQLIAFAAEESIFSIAMYSDIPMTQHFMSNPNKLAKFINSEQDFILKPSFCSWGFGTWKAKWNRVSSELNQASTILGLLKIPLSPLFEHSFVNYIHHLLGTTDAYDPLLTLSCARKRMKHLSTKYSMVKNIGFGGGDATHCKEIEPLINHFYQDDYNPTSVGYIDIEYFVSKPYFLYFQKALFDRLMRKFFKRTLKHHESKH